MLGGDWERSAPQSDLLATGRFVPAFSREPAGLPATRREEQDEDNGFRCIFGFFTAIDRLWSGYADADSRGASPN
jgi:hypothetical protein